MLLKIKLLNKTESVTYDKPIPITTTVNGKTRYYILMFTKNGNLLLNADITKTNTIKNEHPE